MKRFCLLALCLLSGCFATAQSVNLPDGTSGYQLSCGHYINDMSDCLQKAGEICGAAGYQTYDSSGHVKSEDVQTSAAIQTLNTTPSKQQSGAQSAQTTLFVKCRGAPTPSPMASPVTAAPLPLAN